VGRPSAPVGRDEGVESSGSVASLRKAGSEALVFAESVARRFRVRPRLVEGLLAVPSRRALRLWRSFGAVAVESGCCAGPSGRAGRVRGSEVKVVSLKGTQGEYRPWWRGNPRSRERIRRGIKASKGTEFAVRAIPVSWIQGNWELGFGWVKRNP
jgi:hypothetical protein